MKTTNNFLRRSLLSCLILFSVAGFSGCSNMRTSLDTCKETSMESWTTEFIKYMNAGWLPDDANEIAEAVSVEALVQCMKETN